MARGAASSYALLLPVLLIWYEFKIIWFEIRWRPEASICSRDEFQPSLPSFTLVARTSPHFCRRNIYLFSATCLDDYFLKYRMYDFYETNNGYQIPMNRFAFHDFSFAKFKMHCHMDCSRVCGFFFCLIIL
jgi:hypothetical protein